MRITTMAAAVAALAFLALPTTGARADDWKDNMNMGPLAGAKSSARTASRSRTASKPAAESKPAPTREASAKPAQRASRSSGGYSAPSTGGGTTGVASFYWQPQRVAAGGWFNPNAMTAAHKTLPFGTRVRVTHLGNGRSVEVTINDRGPYIAGRIIDLSKAAAGVINMQGQGVAQVRMEVLGR